MTGQQLLEMLQALTEKELKRSINMLIQDEKGRTAWAIPHPLYGVYSRNGKLSIAGVTSNVRILKQK